MKDALDQYRLERANLESEIAEFLAQKFADFKEKTGAEVIYLDVELDAPEDEDEFVITNVFIGTDL